MDEQIKNKSSQIFEDGDQLLLHQLRLMEWLDSNKEADSSEQSQKGKKKTKPEIPAAWKLTEGIKLYPWQEQCIEKWFECGGRGTVKVVTGGGKTLLALAIAERLQNRKTKDLRVAIVVPTIVLMHQWYDELIERGNMPAETIGRLGGGYQEDFSNGRRILIGVLASAQKFFPKFIKKANVGGKLLLVADECHHMGAKEASQIFAAERVYNLGLSATPEREEDNDPAADAGYDGSLLGRELGPIIYNFNLADALALGVIPPFTIYHYGLPLNPKEREQYERLSRSITDAQNELRHRAPDSASSGASFFQWARRIAQKSGESSGIAMRYVNDVSRRKRLLFQVEARINAVVALLEKEFSVNPEARVILFHESIEEVMNLFCILKERGFAAIAEHSKLTGSIRETGLQLFRKGIARIIVSARSLIEGFNVPAVDMAIIVASSSSVRQRVQSLGRVLRKHKGRDGEEKTSCIHILYCQDTVDDAIYGKLDWESTTGVDRNLYFAWSPGAEPFALEGPPKTPLPTELEVNESELTPGELYKGEYAGEELSCDTKGNIQNNNGDYAQNSADLAEKVQSVKGSAGRFRITPKKKFVLVRTPEGDEWVTKFVTRLSGPLDFAGPEEQTQDLDVDEEQWLSGARPGDLYPFPTVPAVQEDIHFKSKRGGVLSKKIPGGEAFARIGPKAVDQDKGKDGQNLLEAIRKLQSEGRFVTKMDINGKNHVVFREKGQLHFLAKLDSGLEFPE